MGYLNLISIILEAIVVIFSLMIALQKKLSYGWSLSFTFLVYVFYDLARIQNWQISDEIMAFSFLAASISALITVYLIFKK